MIKCFHYTTRTPVKRSDILFGSGASYSNVALAFLRKIGHRCLIVTDSEVERYIGTIMRDYLKNQGFDVESFIFPSGEKSKSEEVKTDIIRFMHRQKYDRDCFLIALGGGITTDLGGYVAAVFLRGIPLVNIPTSLIGMTDAALGGKTGVNIFNIKNLVGCIYHPRLVIIDPNLLTSLPEVLRQEGYAEILKYGITLDYSLFRFMETQETVNTSIEFLTPLIYKSCLIKTNIIQKAEKKPQKRDLLNFGHTIGHALEASTQNALSHGEAVKIGMIIESFISFKAKNLSYANFQRIVNLVLKYGISKLPDTFAKDEFFYFLKADKKTSCEIPHFVKLRKIGRCYRTGSACCFPVSKELIEKSFHLLKHVLPHISNSEHFQHSRRAQEYLALC